MAQHLAASLLPPRQRHWVGPELLLGNDHCKVISLSGIKAVDVANFWHVLALRPDVDQVLFNRS